MIINKQSLVALGALVGALTACGSNIQAPPGGTGAGTGTAATGGTGPGTGGTGGTGAGGTGAVAATGNCVAGIPVTTEVPRMKNRQYDAVVRDLLGVTTVGPDGKPPSAGLNADFDGVMAPDAWSFYQQVGSAIAHAVVTGANRSKFIACDPAMAACLTDTIKAFGRKAFRRVLTPDEQASFARLTTLMPNGTPDEVAESILYTFLVSPSFLLMPELAPDLEGSYIKLSQQEVATRLSFLLWDSVPDDELNAAADAGMLATKEQILTQAKRMVQVQAKSGPMLAAFHKGWVGDNETATSHWWKIDHPGNTAYNSAAKVSYQAEIAAFFQDVAFSNGMFKDIFLSPVAFVTKDSAAVYGLDPAKYGTELTKVSLDATTRPGFLTRIGFLSSYAHDASTSPILRGAFITVNMLAADPGAPDPEAKQVSIPDTYDTERGYVDALTSSQPSCKGCHIQFINPPGYVLESFDSVGKIQTKDPRGGTINTTATVSFTPEVTKEVSTPLQLMQGIADSPKAKHLYAEKWVAFATGRDPNDNDGCTVNGLDAKLAGTGYTVLNLVADLTQSDSFRLRVRATP